MSAVVNQPISTTCVTEMLLQISKFFSCFEHVHFCQIRELSRDVVRSVVV